MFSDGGAQPLFCIFPDTEKDSEIAVLSLEILHEPSSCAHSTDYVWSMHMHTVGIGKP